MLGGCMGREAELPASADPALARLSLEKALTCWCRRSAPEMLQSSEPPITIADEDWHAGCRLIEFQLLSGEIATGATLRWPVRLRLARANGRVQVIDTTYVIAHSHTMHIARSD